MTLALMLCGCGAVSAQCQYGDASCEGSTDGATADAGSMDAGDSDAGNPLPSCATGELRCGGACIDVSSNDQDCGACGNACAGRTHCGGGQCRASNIEHVVLIVEENHTFDNYFGHYCQAPADSNPACTEGPACCEAAPATDPNGFAPKLFDDGANLAADPNHSQACELEEIDGGAMDGFTRGSDIGSSVCSSACSRHENFAVAEESSVGTYWSYASQYALADRYFQPIVGSSSSNDMYFASAHAEFVDNQLVPASIGSGCADPLDVCETGTPTSLMGRVTIGDLLLASQHTFAVYADGYTEALAAGSGCAAIPDDCPYDLLHPILRRSCLYDPSDIPFEYFSQFTDNPTRMRDYNAFNVDLVAGALPDFSFIKARTFRNEHPEFSTISDGESFVEETVQAVLASPYADNTLILLTWDEGGGFFDHIAPPPSVDTDDQGKPVPQGTRVPLLALGPFAKVNSVSHVVMNHASIVSFLEYNFVGKTGLLQAADARVNGIGSLLDPARTGIPIP